MTSSLVVLTFLPSIMGKASVNLPASLTGQKGMRPYLFPVSKSSGPNPGAVWTHPVLSFSTYSASRTL